MNAATPSTAFARKKSERLQICDFCDNFVYQKVEDVENS